MRPYIFKIPAGAEDAQFFGPSNVVYLSPRASVRVTVKNPDNEEQFELTPGSSARLSTFQELRISHDGASEATFTLYVGMGTEARTAQVSGNIQPVGGSDNAAEPPMVKGIVDPLPTVQGIVDPLTPDSMADHWGGTGGTTLVTIIAPSANVNGIRIDGCGLLYGGASVQARIMAATAAPASISDTAARTLAYSANVAGSAYQTVRGVIVPAGEGVYAQGGGAFYYTIEGELL